MGVFKDGGPTQNRRPALRGTLQQAVAYGQERVSIWPPKRGKATRAKTKEQNDWFREASWAAKFLDPKTTKILMEWRKGTPILPRDLAFAMFAGRLFSIHMRDGRKIYSVAAQKDISDSLDVLGQLPGSMLWRTDLQWTFVPPPPADRYYLRSREPGEVPEWVAQGVAGFGRWFELAHWDAAVDGAVPSVVADIRDYNSALIMFQNVGSAGSAWRAVQVSTDNGVTYHDVSGDYQNVSNTGTPSAARSAILHSTTSTSGRFGTAIIENTNDNRQGKPIITPGDGLKYFTANDLPITHVRAIAWTGSALSNLTSGRVQILGR